MILRGAGLTASSAVLAGCIDDSSTDTDPDASGDGSGDEEQEDTESNGSNGSQSDGDTGADGADADTDADTDGDADETESDGDDTDSSATNHTFVIEPGTEILFRSDALTWVGERPSALEDVANPTIVLTEGARYTIRWTENESSIQHNIAIYTGDGTVHTDLETDVVSEPGDGQVLEFEASSETAEYVCQPHYSAGMAGSIEVRSSDDSRE
jgi:hypothetical protein